MTQHETLRTAERIALMEPNEPEPHRYDGIIDIEPEEFKDGCEFGFHCDFHNGEFMDIEFFCSNGYSYNVHKDNFMLISRLFSQYEELIQIAERKAEEAYENDRA